MGRHRRGGRRHLWVSGLGWGVLTLGGSVHDGPPVERARIVVPIPVDPDYRSPMRIDHSDGPACAASARA